MLRAFDRPGFRGAGARYTPVQTGTFIRKSVFAAAFRTALFAATLRALA